MLQDRTAMRSPMVTTVWQRVRSPAGDFSQGKSHSQPELGAMVRRFLRAQAARTLSSACSNGSNIRLRASLEMPTPWSAIDTSTYSSAGLAETVILPRDVNLHAFVNCHARRTR